MTTKREKIARSAAVVTYTVLDASRILIEKGKNREPKKGHIKNLADVILSGKNEDNGEAVIFDWYGRLIDGQNRFEALVLAGEKDPNATWTTTVSYGVDPKAFWSIDQNSPRSTNDVFAIKGEDWARELAVAARFIWSRLYQGTVAASGKFRADVALDVVRDHAGLEDSVNLVMETETDNTGQYGSVKALGITPGLLAALHYLFVNRNIQNDGTVPDNDDAIDKAEQFVTLLASEAQEEKLPTNHPVRRLAGVLLRNRGTKKYSRKALIGLVIKAWDAFYQDKELTRLEIKETENPHVGGLDIDPEGLEGEDESVRDEVEEATPKKRKSRKTAEAEQVEEAVA